VIHSVVYASGPPLEFLYINEISPKEWVRAINVDVNDCFNMAEVVLPHLPRQKSDNIVALVSGPWTGLRRVTFCRQRPRRRSRC